MSCIASDRDQTGLAWGAPMTFPETIKPSTLPMLLSLIFDLVARALDNLTRSCISHNGVRRRLFPCSAGHGILNQILPRQQELLS